MRHVDIDRVHDYIDRGLLKYSKWDDLMVICYTPKCQYEKLWDDLTIQARGLVIDAFDGEVVGYCLPKFFNLGEIEETTVSNLPLRTSTYEIFEKMDGSLLHIFNHENYWWYTTKCSFNNYYIDKAKEFVDHKKLHEMSTDYSLVAEIRVPNDPMARVTKNEDGIYLITAFNKATGNELTFGEVENIAKNLNVRTVKRFEPQLVNELLDGYNFYGLKDTEGWVVRFADDKNTRVKLKTAWYLELNRVLENIETPEKAREYIKDVIKNYEYTLNGISALPDEYYEECKAVGEDILRDYEYYQEKIKYQIEDLTSIYTTRKAFAVAIEDCPYKHILFLAYDGRPYLDLLWEFI